MELLPQSFYDRSVEIVAKDLIGKVLVGRNASGIIVETEAYSQEDPASHSYGGKKNRNAVMYEAAGHGYVYFIYGMYWCFNCVCEPKDTGSAVLIRALIPSSGISLMKERRNKEKETDLCSGPGKLTQALDIRKSDNGLKLYSPKSPVNIYYAAENEYLQEDITSATRIGISQATDVMWRFGVKDSKYLSRPL